LPETGWSAAALTRRSKTAPGDPKVLLVAYAVKAKIKMMMSNMNVCTQSVKNVALIPPNMVYIMTPNGSKKQAAGVGIPVRDDTTADPPVNNIAVTRMLVIKPKTVKTMWAFMPYLALMTSRKV
jgi:hypothetical protein